MCIVSVWSLSLYHGYPRSQTAAMGICCEKFLLHHVLVWPFHSTCANKY